MPILGPRFVPPTYLHSQLQPGPTDVQSDIQYLKPISIIHPLYYLELAKCPRCQSSKDVTWEGWTTMGACELHGISHEETALGLQLRCNGCKRNGKLEKSAADGATEVVSAKINKPQMAAGPTKENEAASGYCFALTSHTFWKGWNHWEIPGMPILSHKSSPGG